jgi:hypothetical protein
MPASIRTLGDANLCAVILGNMIINQFFAAPEVILKKII